MADAVRSWNKQHPENKKGLILCGKMSSDFWYLPLILGLGITDITINARKADELNYWIHKLDTGECRALVEQVLTCGNAPDARAHIDSFWERMQKKHAIAVSTSKSSGFLWKCWWMSKG